MEVRERVMAYIDEHEQEMIEFWKNLVQLESPSADIDGVAQAAAHLDTYCGALGLSTQKYIYEHAGPSLAAWTKEGPLPGVVLMGHMDTVHRRGAFGKHAFVMDGENVHGPGVYDCKGGIVTAFFVIKALMYGGYDKRQLKILLSGDEETAHSLSNGDSLALYKEGIQGCEVAFNCESGLLSGDVITERKGGASLIFRVYGIASHAGAAPQDGASAIKEAARKILDIEALTDYEGTTFNCGTIKGGSGVNVIPDYCEFGVGIRFRTNEEEKEALAQLEEIAKKVYIKGVRTEMETAAGFKAMEKTKKTEPLFEVYKNACIKLGYKEPNMVSSGGCSDGAYVAMEQVPVLCGVGVRGAHNHSKEEYAVIKSMKERTRILAETILSLPDDF
ncbi:M20/M25/M40 family metallo-hydrolase [Clostridium sp. MCC353]|uniref:M20/M25/M40 family metallo-hydrolase n=1 Tax=Clostridium sp. MCC353 TaxID=2592646 RepID=UPI001C00C776|nr:M20/M25/M40 family metallo-hydrolase [Clostridium sp. MCC353]MBT9778235.1 M20/M25/M40 family metallo-hydrolase [Clostridium sp. MCC353]